jgi:hypothetical protein
LIAAMKLVGKKWKEKERKKGIEEEMRSMIK